MLILKMLALIVDVFFLSLQQGKNKSILQRQKKLTDGSISENYRGQYTGSFKAFFIKN